MTLEQRLELLNFLSFMHNKLTRLGLRLFALGEDTTTIDEARQQLEHEIDQLRSMLMNDWAGEADQIIAELRQLNEQAQRSIRNLNTTTDRLQKVARIIELFDEGLNLVKAVA